MHSPSNTNGKAYSRIHGEYIVPVDYSGMFIVAGGCIDRCFVATLQYLIKDGYTVCGMDKTAAGGSNGARWKTKYSVVGNGGGFASFFQSKRQEKGSINVDAPVVENIEALSDAEIELWAKPFAFFNGEEAHRHIYVSKNSSMYVFETDELLPLTPDKSRIYDKNEWEFRKVISIVKVMRRKITSEL